MKCNKTNHFGYYNIRNQIYTTNKHNNSEFVIDPLFSFVPKLFLYLSNKWLMISIDGISY